MSLDDPEAARTILVAVPPYFIGTCLAVVLLCLLGAATWLVVHRPFLGLGVLVSGMALHNFVLMVLLVQHTPPLLIRLVQGWKEIVLGVLFVLAATHLVRARTRWHWRSLIAMDWLAIAFSLLLVVYLVLPADFLPGTANFVQRLLAFRTAALIPLVYFIGRTFSSPPTLDLRDAGWLIVGAGAVVGAFGLFELWFVPSATWLDWGVNLFSSWLGFKYNGPAGLPENFFQTLPDGLLLRRMVSTYISPLGIAYTGLLCWPIAVALLDRPQLTRRVTLVTGVAASFLLLGILFSVTRLALAMLAVEVIILAVLLRTRLALALAPVVLVAVLGILFAYPLVGPVVDPHLLAGESRQHTIIYAGDPSFLEHLRALSGDFRLVGQHPFGSGLGGSVHRFVEASADTGTGESAVLGIFGDIGIAGGVLYLAMYGLALYAGVRALGKTPRRHIALMLPLVAVVGGIALIPITLTSDVWSDFSVTFLFWWAVGYSVSAAARPAMVAAAAAIPQAAAKGKAVAGLSVSLIDRLAATDPIGAV